MIPQMEIAVFMEVVMARASHLVKWASPAPDV
jgi:hypothetical protein